MRFDSESYIQNYTKSTITCLLIEYDDNMASEQDSSKNLVIGYLGYVHTNRRENSKVY
jgi:hypothetical protein